ncbi:MAG TPA: DUF2161 family putative PD-(D/E)XK-type phosphodiesterase [Arenibaculum sp.]|nr:DUF2161 family putative PD-(D/E)XK-type phosphodiesterase [Arenibaculum sp.]
MPSPSPERAAGRESDLYPPIKRFLETAGFAVRGEVGRCDAVAVKDGTMIAVELKLAFGLPVIHQAIDRQAVADLVYIGVARPSGATARRTWERQLPDTVRLCRLLGLGLLSVGGERVTIHADPGPYRPRRHSAGRKRLLREFMARSGDHNRGGSSKVPVVTAYREDALRCADLLAARGTLAVAEIRRLSGVERAGTILLRNVYGWFERSGRGIYGLAPAGHEALRGFADVVAEHRRAEHRGRVPEPAEAG